MRDFELYYTIILFGLIIFYIILCNNVNIYYINHKNKLIVTKLNTLSENNKLYNFILNSVGLLICLLLIVFEINYISKNHNYNIYIRSIQLIFVISMIILLNLPNEYKNETFIQITNSYRPLSILISTIFISAITSFYTIIE